MTRAQRNIGLAIAVALIIIAIGYLESKKVHGVGSGNGGIAVVATTTPHTPDFNQRKAMYEPSIEFIAPDGYVNTNNQPITLQSFIGKK
jgi:hypothetical protein